MSRFARLFALFLAVLLLTATSSAKAHLSVEPVMHGGNPAIECRAERFHRVDLWTIERNAANGKPEWRVPLAHNLGMGPIHVDEGTMRLSADRISFEPASPAAERFDQPRTAVRATRAQLMVYKIETAGKTWRFAIPYRIAGSPEVETFGDDFGECTDLVLRAFADFPGADATFLRLTESLHPAAPTTAVSPAAVPGPPAPATGSLVINTQPPSSQIYLDDAFKGTSSAEGKLVVTDVKVGLHVVRLTAPGFKEMTQAVSVSPGDNPLLLTAQRAGPKPLTEPEVEKALRDGIPKPRVEALIKEFGVDFALTNEVQQHLRDAGATDGILLAVATNRK